MVSDRIKQIAERAGLVVGRWPYYHTTAYHIRELIRRYEINLVFDVGAFVGDYGRLLRRLGYERDIHSFEPTAASFELLRAAADDDPLWHVHNFALGATRGTREITVYPNSDMSSFLPASDFGRSQYRLGEGDVRTEVVEVRPLDEGGKSGHRNVFVKLDVQGAEFDVIEGAPETMRTARVLQIELPILAPYEGIATMEEALGRLREMGFVLTGVFPVSHDADSLKLGDVDCFLVR